MSFKFALLGTGRIADAELAPALTASGEAELWSVLSRDRDRAEAFANKHGAQSPGPAYDDLDALLADDELDAVLVATPDKLHHDQVMRAARAGKHVLTEKPMAATATQAQQMVDACRDAGVKLGVAYHLRWHDGHRRLHAQAMQGRFGDIRHMRVQWARKAPDANNWRAKTEVGRWWSLAAVGTHCLDQVRWFMGPGCGEIEKLHSVINRSVFDSPHDETAVLAIQFASGATAEICTSMAFDGARRMEIYGAEDHALCEDTLGAEGAGEIRTREGVFAFDVVNPYVGEIDDFVGAVNEGREPEVGGHEGARNVALLEQACP